MPKGRFWTDKETAYLIKAYATKTAMEIANEIGRTVSAITSKIRDMGGLHKPPLQKKKAKTIECACGCGEALISLDKKGRNRRFIQGHNGKTKESRTKFALIGKLRGTKRETIDGVKGKVCTECQVWKPLTEYGKHKIPSDGLN